MEVPHPGYFEGILQLRPATEEVLSFLEQEMSMNERLIITKQKHGERGNMDLFISNQKVLLQLAKKLSTHFLAIVKTSRRAHTMEKMTRKSLYRVNVLFRPIDIKRGTTRTYRGKEYMVTLVGKGQVQLQDQTRGKKFWVNLEEFS